MLVFGAGSHFESFSPAIDTVLKSRAEAGEKVAGGRMRARMERRTLPAYG